MFIQFEGPEGCGKSTQAAKLANFFREKEYDVIVTREPGSQHVDVCTQLRSIMLHNQDLIDDKLASLFLFLADRTFHTDQLIAKNKNKVVISDRGFISSLVYQSILGNLDFNLIFDLNMMAMNNLLPDKIIYIKVATDTAIKRVEKRVENNYDMNFLERSQSLINAYDTCIEKIFYDNELLKKRIIVVDGNGREEDVFEKILQLAFNIV